MIIARSPLRITLGGGGTDLPSYYRKHGGFLIAAAINKYVYVTVHKTFLDHMLIRYSKIETVQNASEVKHPIVREALKLLEITDRNIEITSMADIPAGTGLGSSGSFTTALLKALYKYKQNFILPDKLADLACHIELNLLQEPIGKQDQYIAAYGGVTVFEFGQNGDITARALNISNDSLEQLRENTVIFSTGFIRSASEILKEQDSKSKSEDPEMVANLHVVKEIGYKSCEALEKGDLNQFGLLMHEHWTHKKKRSKSMSNGPIDEWYGLALEHGAVGGKLIGAGGGGFLMFYTEQPKRLRTALSKAGLFEMRVNFDFEGTKLLT